MHDEYLMKRAFNWLQLVALGQW